MKRTSHGLALGLALLAGLALILAACGGGQPTPSGSVPEAEAPASPSPAAPAEPQAAVASAESSLGQTLVDAEGRTLYAFTKDKGGKSTCYGDCEATWPALVVEGAPEAGDGVRGSLLATTDRDDGSAQVTYKRMPLYLFSGDQQPGDTNGQGVGGVWFAVTPDGGLVGTSGGTTGDGGGNDGGGQSGGGYGYP
jgi:predicted lipoprotein with Yx(FWY)xxD motif